jgi:tetratricopeptide (TPR) repeat protein
MSTPRDGPVYLVERKRPIGVIIVILIVLSACVGCGFYYWWISSTYSDVYRRLNIPPLPLTVEIQPGIYDQVSQLSREPCYQAAIIRLSDSLLELGYPRQSATSLLAFANRCGRAQNESLLVRAYSAFKKIGDFSAALEIVDRLVKSDPADPEYRYSRGVTHEQLRDFSSALTDYIAALQLMGTPDDIDGSQFYDISRMYASLGRFCDAIAPIETFISFKPTERRTPQTIKIISEYAQQGGCDVHYARGVGHVPLLDKTGVHALVVTVNGVAGNFILDSGAELVTLAPDFAAKANVAVETANQIPMKTAGGIAIADLGNANKISVGNAGADGVTVAIIRGSSDPFGGHLDGLLGMSFLARFNLHMSPDGIDLTVIPLR